MALIDMDFNNGEGTKIQPMCGSIMIHNSGEDYACLDTKQFTQLIVNERNTNYHSVYVTSDDFDSDDISVYLNGAVTWTFLTYVYQNTPQTIDITNYTAIKFYASGIGANCPQFVLS